MERTVKLTKRQAKGLLSALEWSECDFTLGKAQQQARKAILDVFPEYKVEVKKENLIP